MYGMGEYFRSGCHIMILGVVHWNLPRSQADSSTIIQVHQDTIEDIGHWIHKKNHITQSQHTITRQNTE